MPELYMLCGIPTSGKSTYTKTNFGMQLNTDFVVLSTDNYLEAIAQQNNSTYNEVFDAFIGQATKRLEFDLISATMNSKTIIWDQTNLSAKTRKKKLKKIPETYSKTAIYFEIELEQALERNETREGKFIPKDILKRMYHQFEIPTLEEGFDSIVKGKGK